MPECFKPYDDDFMRFDKITHQYVLTEAALLSKGIDIRARMSATATVSPENVIQTLVETVSDMIYQYIHDQSMDNDAQDWVIAHNPRLRLLMQRAMLAQAVHVINLGNLYLSSRVEDRENAINTVAKSLLDNVISCAGTSITYRGEW